MSRYLAAQPTKKKTPQSKPIPGREKDMSRNNAGGFAFKADSFAIMERFLILGTEGGSYYVGEADLTSQNLDNVRACIERDGQKAVNLIRDISVGGRAPKNDPALYALALAASFSDKQVRDYALDTLPAVARTGTHLFTFAEFIDKMRGWGPALRRAVGAWYLEMPVGKLAYQLVKYQQRNGWSHRDLLRLAHPKTEKKDYHTLFKWVVKDTDPDGGAPDILEGFLKAKTSKDEKTTVKLIAKYGLTREMIRTEHQTSPEVWEALLDKMPLTAMIRTLGRMGASGLLAPLSSASKLVVKRLEDAEYLQKSRVHPIAILAALLTYKEGHGVKGSLTWQQVPKVVAALDDAFYLAFKNVEPTGKNFYLGIDVSGSMTSGQVAGIQGLTPNMGAAAMAMLVARTEPNHFIGGFSHEFIDLKVTARDMLKSAMQKCQQDFGGTDCAIAIQHALKHKYPVDAFVIISDGETWAGEQHSSQALEQYRTKMKRDAKLIVINMVANRTRIGDPKDPGSLDCVGFDASVPQIITSFVGGKGLTNEEAN